MNRCSGQNTYRHTREANMDSRQINQDRQTDAKRKTDRQTHLESERPDAENTFMPSTKPSKPWWSSSYGSFNGLCSALWETLFISHSIKPLQSAHTHSLTVTWGWFLDYGNLIRCTEQSRSCIARSLTWEEAAHSCCCSSAPRWLHHIINAAYTAYQGVQKACCFEADVLSSAEWYLTEW